MGLKKSVHVTLYVRNMSGSGVRVDGNPSLSAGLGRLRKAVAAAVAAIVIGCSMYGGVKNSIREYHIVFYDAPRMTLSAAMLSQLDIVKKTVPRGSYIIYLMDKPETWRFGLWKRSLFPDYILLPIAGLKQLDTPAVKTFRERHQVRYMIIADSTVPPGVREVLLPLNPDGTKMILAVEN